MFDELENCPDEVTINMSEEELNKAARSIRALSVLSKYLHLAGESQENDSFCLSELSAYNNKEDFEAVKRWFFDCKGVIERNE